MKTSIERVVNEYARLRKESFRLKKAISQIPELRNEFAAFLDVEVPDDQPNAPSGRGKSDLVVATIMDEFSNENWSPEFCNIMLSFADWEREIDYFQPDLLFVESAWQGNFSEWAHALEAPRVHSNARELDRLLELCRQRGIPTIFWNKEDPLHFEKFVDAAKSFDLVFTTDARAIERYKGELGHPRVFALPFAAQPFLCNPVGRSMERDHRAFFAGSYYAFGHGSRTQQMDMLFDALLAHGGVIYDRAYYSDSLDVKMPEKYRAICAPPVSFDEIVDVYKRHSCALNVNSVSDSPTMMSRRVFEVLACATPVISTPCDAIDNLLGCAVDQVACSEEAERALMVYSSDADEAARRGHMGYRRVLREHTYNHRLVQIATAVDAAFPGKNMAERLRHPCDNAKLTLILPCEEFEKAKPTFRSLVGQTHNDFELLVLTGPEFGLSAQEHVRQICSRMPVSFHAQETADADSLTPVLSAASGELVVLLRDSEVYGPQMLEDLALPLRYTEASIIGKASYFSYCKETDATRLNAPDKAHRYVGALDSGPMLFTKEAMPLLAERSPLSDGFAQFFKQAAALGLRTYSCDPYNVLSHEGQIEPDDRHLGEGLLSELVNI